ncbi:hypothetical protein AB0A74_12515 [Saccharothrix sp. NPDC042600]|uniref:Uncharacterized protein n=1 Tax=Saccharothrix variisporea TaxID=543527 RepID=A0A495XBI3_9PSEU|nr:MULTISPECIES: hypothetical protein [Saccharothrix]NUT96956.1 hypothetical protein [Saccharothrix sp.]RKT70475.1 hypothetical protein DFJ66_3741 [Saccharothrix variisporea]BFE55026.1 hypothetical protein GCM10017745_84530 [Saccharothrix mutabilis subsp. capreolus]
MSDDVATAQVLSTNIFDSAAEAIEAIGAADVLGLGVKVSNRLVPDEDGDDSFVEEWVVELLTSVPTVDED